MPALSRFFGIVIMMYFNDHDPPHFHVRYGEHSAKIDIDTFEVSDGSLPRRVLGLTLEWAALHRMELRENWAMARRGVELAQIAPLD